MGQTEGGETLVFKTHNKEKADSLRHDLLKNFRRVWVYVHNYDEKEWEISVANNWGGRIDSETLTNIENFIKEFDSTYSIDILNNSQDLIKTKDFNKNN